MLISPDQVVDYLDVQPAFILDKYDSALPDILAAHINSFASASLLVGATLDPSGLAIKIANSLRTLSGKVVLIEGQPKLHLSSKAGFGRKSTGWSDEFKKLTRSTAAFKLNTRLTKSIATNVNVAGFGRYNQAAIGKVLSGNSSGMMGVISFPLGARQLANLPENTPLIIVAQLGRTKQRDLAHLKTFIKNHQTLVVLLA